MEGQADSHVFGAFAEGCRLGSLRKALLTERWKLVYDLYEDDFRLYDLDNDPGERRNIYSAEHAPDIADMQERLLQWVEDSNAIMRNHVRVDGHVTPSAAMEENLEDMGYIQ
jgi:arylsulfatase A-like enzyme